MGLKRRQTFRSRTQGFLVWFIRKEYTSIEISVLASILARIASTCIYCFFVSDTLRYAGYRGAQALKVLRNRSQPTPKSRNTNKNLGGLHVLWKGPTPP